MPARRDRDFPLEREPTPAEQAALAWVIRCDRGLNAAEQREFDSWVAANPQHRELFAEFGGMWTVLREARAEFIRAETAPACNEAPARNGRAAGARTRRFWLPLAAAAALVFAAMGTWRMTPRPVTAATAVGAMRTLALPDGSTVELNTDSAVVAAFTAGERRVRLTRGEAYFRVAKDRARPFVVAARGVGVRAVGTEFNVRMRTEGVEVLVTEGRVRVAPGVAAPAESPREEPAADDAHPAGSAEVAAGQRVIVPVTAGAARAAPAPAAPLAVASVAADEVQRRLAWHARRLEFSDTSLDEMVAEFNRYHRRKLSVADPALAAMRFGGSFRPDDRAGFVRVLRDNFGIVAEERASETLLRARP